MSRVSDARRKHRPADPCAFCGARVPRRRPTDKGEPKLCEPCDGGSSYQFTVRQTIGKVHPFADNRWRQADLVDAGAALRFGTESQARRSRR